MVEIINQNFRSIEEMLQTLEQRPVGKSFIHGHSESGSYGFTHTKSYEEAANLMRNGYDKAVSAFTGAALEYSGVSNRATTRNYYVGSSPVVARAIQGLPDAMRQIHRIPQKSKVVKIMYDCDFHAGISADDIEKTGANFYACLKGIEQSGVRVEVATCCSVAVRGDKGRYDILIPSVTVKGAGQLADAGRMSFCLCHPSFLRRIVFKWLEVSEVTSSEKYRGDSCGYGRPAVNSYKKTITDFFGKSGYIFIPGLDILKKTPEQISEYIRSRMEVM